LFPLTCLFRLHAEREQFTFCSKWNIISTVTS
jgi:hypothetical protein